MFTLATPPPDWNRLRTFVLLLTVLLTAIAGLLAPVAASAGIVDMQTEVRAPMTSIAIGPSSSAITQVQVMHGDLVPGRRVVVIKRPLTAIALPGMHVKKSIASN